MRPNQPETNTTAPVEMQPDPSADEIQSVLKSSGPAAAIARLIEISTEKNEPRPLLDSLLLKARFELGLPGSGAVSEQIDPELKLKYEDKYVEAIRQVGQRLLDQGQIASAWPYFRVIGEKEPVKAAIEAFDPSQADEHALGAVIDVAFQQQVHPVKGFSWILDRYGICSTISSFEALPNDEQVRAEAAALLTKALYEQLQYSLASEIERRDGTRPEADVRVSELLQGRPWIYDDDAYAIDISHLSSVVRLSPLLKDEASIKMAAELAIYGSGLSDRFRYDGLPPFEDIYADHLIYLNALLGCDIENAISHFRGKMAVNEAPDEFYEAQQPDPMETLPAQTLVKLLARLGKKLEAIEVASQHLMGVPEGYLLCPSLTTLCREAKRLDLLAKAAAGHGDLALCLGSLIEEMQSAGKN
ncbi:MAG: hypothetical protein ACKO5E_10940 [bacterium]